MNRTLKTIAITCVAGLLTAGAAVGIADARGFGGFGGGHMGGFGGGHAFAGGHAFGGGHAIGAVHSYGGGHPGHIAGGYGGHHDHGGHDHFHHGHFIAGFGPGFYYDDYAYPYYDTYYGSGCSYERHMWGRTGSSYWHNRYEACLSG